MLTFTIEPNVVKSWDNFKLENPTYSIALDGYVSGPPKYDPEGPLLNLNHHDGVIDLSTKCTCAQLYSHIMNGLFTDRFVKNGKPFANAFVNDPDQDVSMSYYLYKNSEKINSTKTNHLLDRLIKAEDHLDSTAGAYPYDLNTNLMKDIAWIFDPYTSVRMKQDIQSLREEDMMEIILSVYKRIDKHLNGRGLKRKPDVRYDEIYREDKCVMFKEIGPYARTDLFNKGMRFFVIVIDKGNGKYGYKLSTTMYYNGRLNEIYDKCNKTDNVEENDIDRWNGSQLRGGSPRKKGSKIKPAGMIEIIKDTLR